MMSPFKLRIGLLVLLLVSGFGASVAEAGFVADCASILGHWWEPHVSVKPLPGQSQAEAWIETLPFSRRRFALLPQPSLRVWKKGLEPHPAERLEVLRRQMQQSLGAMKTARKAGKGEDFRAQQIRHIVAASGVLETEGVSHVLRVKHLESMLEPSIEILIEPDEASALGRVAAGLQRMREGAEFVYDPESNLAHNFSGAYSDGRPQITGGVPTLYTSEASIVHGIRGSLTLRHELQHAYYSSLRHRGASLGWVHGSIRIPNRKGAVSLFDDDIAYAEFMSFEEVSNHGKDLRVLLSRLSRGLEAEVDPEEVDWKVYLVLALGEKTQAVAARMREAIEAGLLEQEGRLVSWTAGGRRFEARARRVNEKGFEAARIEVREQGTPRAAEVDLVIRRTDSSQPDFTQEEFHSRVAERISALSDSGSRGMELAREAYRRLELRSRPEGLTRMPSLTREQAESVQRLLEDPRFALPQ